ncbi:MAG: hypothetical protein Q9217_004291 [Psora testacea]
MAPRRFCMNTLVHYSPTIYPRYPTILVVENSTLAAQSSNSNSTSTRTQTLNNADTPSHNNLLDDLRYHFTRPSLIPSITIYDAFRKHYPGHSITRTDKSTGLLHLAKAGHAQAVLDKSVSFYGSRVFKAPDRSESRPKEKGDGRLRDKVEFGRYRYSWRGEQFLIYAVGYWVSVYDFVKHHYVLYPRAREDEQADNDHEPSTVVDQLIAEAARQKEKVGAEEVWVYDRGYWGKSRRLWEGVRECKWEDVVLDQTMKEKVRGDVEGFFDRESEYKGLAVPWKRGLIFHGLPGNGKTISIKALMRSLAFRPEPIPTLYVKSLGKSSDEDDIRSIFDKARETAPCLLVFEDIDSLVSDHVRSFFLNEVDGLEGNDGIMMIGSTNYLDRLDAGISKRPSRFDRKYHFALPATPERIQYCEYWRAKLSKNSSIELPPQISSAIASITEGFSFAYLQEAFVSALLSIVQTKEAAESLKADDRPEGPTTSENLETNPIWQAMNKQVQTLRKEMKDSRKSVEDSEKNSMLSDAKSSSAVSTGFGLVRLQEQPVEEKEPEYATSSRRHSPVPVSKYNATAIVNQQPQPHHPPRLPTIDYDEEHPAYRGSSPVSKRSAGFKEGPELASKAYTKVRRVSRSNTSSPRPFRRSTSDRWNVSEPTEFRRICVSPVPRLPAFRPIQLSIYIPGNELPKLPKFSDDPDDEDDVRTLPDISRPAQAVMRSSSDTLLSCSTSKFSIPRKPLASRQSSADGIRQSIDSDVILSGPVRRPRTSSLSYSRSRGPSATTNATLRSNQQFLDLLNAPFPPLPPLQTVKPLTSAPENESFVFRRANEQSKRLQYHLQEREQVDARSPDCSTIPEERSPVSPQSPPSSSPIAQQVQPTPAILPRPISNPQPEGLAIMSETPPTDGILKTSHFTQRQDWFPVKPTSAATISLPAFATASSDAEAASRSSSGSSTLLNLTASATPDITCTDSFQTSTIATTITHTHIIKEKPSVGQRMSQWLTGSKSFSKDTLRSTPAILPVGEQERSGSEVGNRSWFDVRDSAESMRAKDVDVEKIILKEERKGLRKRSETESTFVTERGLSIDIEKFPIPEFRAVSLAV